MGVDPGEDPAQNVVLLDDVGVEVDPRRHLQKFAAVDHTRSPLAQETGTNNRHLEISRGESSSGSSLALPAVSRARHASTSGPPLECCSAMKPRRLKTAPFPSRVAYST